jgi:hypothetical protein
MPNMVAYFYQTPIFEWYVILVWLQERELKRRVFKIDRIVCLNCGDCCRFDI